MFREVVLRSQKNNKKYINSVITEPKGDKIDLPVGKRHQVVDQPGQWW